MNRENMLKYVEALESGDFPQASQGGSLKTTHGYCCLGVLEEIRGTHNERPHEQSSFYLFGPDKFSSLPYRAAVVEFLGIPNGFQEHYNTESAGTILVTDDHGEKVFVHVLNDRGVSFREIARMIRREFGLPEQGAI